MESSSAAGQAGVRPRLPSCSTSSTPPAEHSRILEVGQFGVHKLLQCNVCGAQTTEFHYGANTCETCRMESSSAAGQAEDMRPPLRLNILPPDSMSAWPTRTDVRHRLPSSSTSSTPPAENSRILDVGKFGVHKLPPCKVCGAQATGFHYGANTCEACKGFFHRSLSKKDTYICLKNAKCELKPGNRSLCPLCRYQRCVEIGMSKKGIKTGRYSYAKRTQDILEIQGYRNTVSPGPVSPPALNKLDIQQQARVEDIEKLIATMRTARDCFVVAQIQNCKEQQARLQMQNLDTIRPQLLLSLQQPASADVKFHSFKPTVDSNLLIAPGADHEDNVMSTWRKAFGSRTGGLKNIIDFIKAIPGFQDLVVQDQIQLIKYSMAELWIIGRHSTFNLKTCQFTSIHGLTFDLVRAVGAELAELMCKAADRLQKLALETEELFLLTSFLVVSTDRCELEEASSVSLIQNRLTDAILYVLRNKHGSCYLSVFAKIVGVLTQLRSVSHVYLAMTDKMVSDATDMPPLLAEILTLS